MQKIKSSGGILAEILKKVKSPENFWSKFWRKLRARLKIPRLPDLKGGVLNSNTPVATTKSFLSVQHFRTIFCNEISVGLDLRVKHPLVGV